MAFLFIIRKLRVVRIKILSTIKLDVMHIYTDENSKLAQLLVNVIADA